MRLPRDISGRQLASHLDRLGYRVTRQAGSHIRLTTARDGEHHVTLPDHKPLRPGTLQSILRDLCVHHRMSRDDLMRLLFE